MKIFSRLALLAIAAFLAASFALGQQPAQQVQFSESVSYVPRQFPAKQAKKNKDKDAPAAPAPVEPEVMPDNGPVVNESSPISVPVSVFDAQGNFVSDLTKDDFKVFIDGTDAAVLSVEKRNEPLNVYLVIDVSPSGRQALESSKRIAVSAADQFAPEDKISVFSFAGRLKQLLPLTTDRALVKTTINKVKAGTDGTALYDATRQLLSEYVSSAAGRSVVLLMTDGVDTTSTKTEYSQALIEAEKSGIAIFPIYLDTFAAANFRPNVQGLPIPVQQVLRNSVLSRPVAGSSPQEYELGRHYLNDLVYLSGSRAIDANLLLAGKAKVAMNISDEVRRQYYVTFSPVGGAHLGQRKHIKVRVLRPNLAVIARGSYVVGSPPSKVAAQ